MKKLRVKAAQAEVVPLRLDAENEEFWKGEERLRLSRKPFAMLRLLVARRPKWVSKDDFYHAIWQPKEEDVMAWTFTTYVHEIRKALGDEVSPHRYVETGVNRGYRFIGTVTESDRPIQNLETKTEEPPATPQLPQFKIAPNPQPPLPYVVGREAELEQLHRWLDRALAGERQLVFVTGEPGIGKTTLVRTFLREVATKGTAVIGRGQCIEQYGSGEAYLPVLEAIGRLARDSRGNFLVEWMKRYTPTWLVQMPTLLSPTELEEVQRKVQGATRERMLREMSEGFEVLTEQIPFILVLEDLHWSDVSTLDLLSSLAQRTDRARLLIIGTYRPEEGLAERHPLRAITQELQGKRLCQELPLPLLNEVAVSEYLQQRFPTAMLPTRLPETLHRNTEGSPLFLTAVVNDLLERGVITQIDGRWVLQGPVDSVAAEVPVSIRQLLTRQIDRLHDKERQILQAASVAGLEFSTAAVAAAAGIDTAAVEACCEILVRRQQFLRRVGVSEWPDGTQTGRYGFLHALYQQLWHERVPQHRCQRLHLKIGERLEQAYGSRVGELATELAVHFDQGRDTQRAIHYYQHAAGTATQRHAYQEAIAHLTAALSLLKSLPETAARHQRELQLQFSLHWMLGRSKGEAAPELDGVVARERELLQWSEETPQLFGPVFGLFDFYLVRGELASVRFFADYALRLARRFPEEPLLGAASMMMGICEFLEGELLSARTSLEQGMAVYTQSRTEASLFWETGLGCFLYAALTLWHLGFPDQALHCAAETITRARTCGARFVEAWGLNYLAWVQILRGDVAAVRTHATAALQLAEAQGFASMREAGRIYQGWALSMQEDEHKGTLQIQQGIAALHSTSGITFRTFYLALLAEAYGRTGQTEEGLSVLAEALTLVDKTGERFYEAELYRLKGALILQSQTSRERPKASLRQVKASQDRSEDVDPRPLTPDPQAEASFLKAIEIARRQQSKSLELRAVMSLVRLRQRRVSEHTTRTTQHVLRTRLAEAHKMLSETYNWFTEGFATVDLQEAKALLAELR